MCCSSELLSLCIVSTLAFSLQCRCCSGFMPDSSSRCENTLMYDSWYEEVLIHPSYVVYVLKEFTVATVYRCCKTLTFCCTQARNEVLKRIASSPEASMFLRFAWLNTFVDEMPDGPGKEAWRMLAEKYKV